MAKRGTKKNDGVDKELVLLDPIPVGPDGDLMLRPIDVKDILDIIDAENDAQTYKEAAKNLKEKMKERLGSEMAFIGKLVRNARRIQKDSEALKEDEILISATQQFAVMESGVQATRRVDKMNAEIRAEKEAQRAAQSVQAATDES